MTHRRKFLSTLIIAALFVFTSVGVLSAPSEPALSKSSNPPNVLFIAVDDLSDWVGFMRTAGVKRPDVKTPNIDRLAKRGMVFTRAYAPATICCPSRTAIMTGLRPSTSGAYSNHHNFQEIMPDIVTLSEHFKNNGYHAIGRGKIHHTPYEDYSRWDDFERGWGENQYYPEPENAFHYGHIKIAGNACREDQYHDYLVADYAIDYLSKPHDKPFFLACGIHNPHDPWWVPQKYFDMYSLDEIQLPEVKEDDWDDLPPAGIEIARNNSYQKALIEMGKLRFSVRGYLACISFADAMIGRVLDALEASPYNENTIICLWSDHGYHVGEKQHWLKNTLWERSCHIPFIWVVPGMTQPGSHCDRTVELQSIYPTLSSLCGLKIPETVEGYDLTPLLKNPKAESKHPAITTRHQTQHSIRTERWHYITYGGGQEELYDHDTDPNEWTNLAGSSEYQDVIKKLKKQLPQSADLAPLDWKSLSRARINQLKQEGSRTFVDQSDNNFVLLTGHWKKCSDKVYHCSAIPEGGIIAEWYYLFEASKPGTYELEMRYDACGQKNLATNARFTLRSSQSKKFTIDLTQNSGEWKALGKYTFPFDMQKVLELSGEANGNLITPEFRLTKIDD